MSGQIIHDIYHRVVTPEIVSWLRKRVEKTLKEGEQARWYNVAVKAVRYLKDCPVRCEQHHDGTYTVVISSSRDANVEYYATAESCECTGFRATGICYHRMVARLLESVDLYEARKAAHEERLAAEAARRRTVTLTSPIGEQRVAAYYDNVFVGLADDLAGATTLMDAYKQSLEWVQDAAA